MCAGMLQEANRQLAVTTKQLQDTNGQLEDEKVCFV